MPERTSDTAEPEGAATSDAPGRGHRFAVLLSAAVVVMTVLTAWLLDAFQGAGVWVFVVFVSALALLWGVLLVGLGRST
jgi:F0F1-type ATP synthase assembly protein I